MAVPRPATPFTRLHWVEMLLYAVLGAGMVFAVRTTGLRDALLLPSEGAHLFQAHAFADGRLARDPGGVAPLMRHPHLEPDGDGEWFSRFPPGHAAWLAPGVAAGHSRAMVPLAAALTLAGMYVLGWRLRLPRHLLSTLTLASPFFLWLHATVLPETTGMMLATGLLVFYVGGRQESNNLSLTLAALCWAGLYLVSPSMALCLAVPFGVDIWCVLNRNLRSPAHWRGVALIVVAASLGILTLAMVEHAQSGDGSVPAEHIREAGEGWGFGPRRTPARDGTLVPHSLQRGFANLADQLRYLDTWLLGGFPGFLLVWLGLCAHGWSRRWSGLLLATWLTVALAHVAYWDPALSPVGPLHFAEILPFLLAAGGLGLSRIWRKLAARRPQRLALFGAMAAVWLFFALRVHLDLWVDFHSDTRLLAAFHENTEAYPPPLLVFLPEDARIGDPVLNTVALNPRGRQSAILALRAPVADRDALAVALPDRRALVFHPDSGNLDPHRGTFEGRHRVGANSHHSRGTGANNDTARIVDETKHTAGFLFYGWYPFLPPGEYECRFSLRWSGVDEARPLRLEIMTDQGTRTLASKTLGEGLDATTLRFTLEDVTRVEPRVVYGGSGEAVLRSVDLAPILLPAPDALPEPLP